MSEQRIYNILVVGDRKCGKTNFIKCLANDVLGIPYKLNLDYAETNHLVCIPIKYKNKVFNVWEISSNMLGKDNFSAEIKKIKVDYVLIGTKERYREYSLVYWEEVLEGWKLSNVPTYEVQLRSSMVGVTDNNIFHVNVQRAIPNEFASILNYLTIL
ncbi:GTP-binding protein RhoE-like [Orpheovirus IHUMI-LCC2]|uniref:GTP-binding protein RhoE-like n=1 Tax=Orpheovirus IHUMI-LCC2 TaxID=2023057 RepID=A0A2I2L572_9VIRU|nr:GTP-binding protein RhoE-like [Orpheovirus IHUMI-LCC2]SNW62683.1 GTP-binding protein RhoE-like [Orpheovirus IHUMI-LCC2]